MTRCYHALPPDWRLLAGRPDWPEPPGQCELPAGHPGACRAGGVEWVTSQDVSAVRVSAVELPVVESNGSKPDLPAFHVEVRFGRGVPLEAQGPALLAFEKDLRRMGVRAEVFLETRPDDSKLRRSMSAEERKRL